MKIELVLGLFGSGFAGRPPIPLADTDIGKISPAIIATPITLLHNEFFISLLKNLSCLLYQCRT